MLKPVLALLAFSGLLLGGPFAAAAEELVRVHLASAAQIDFGGKLAYEGRRHSGDASKLVIKAKRGELLLEGKQDPGPLWIEARDGIVSVGGRKYRGRMYVRAAGGKVDVINYVPLESYLASVLGGEMGAGWPLEALKAQAVVARSYVLAKMKASKRRAYDVDATVLSQVYKGLIGEAASTRRAVEETDSRVLTYRGEIIEAYFHSTCGGRTEDGRSLWGGNLDYLTSLQDPYCEDAPDYFWVLRVAPKELGAKVGLPPVSEVKVLARAKGGRALKVQFAGGTQKKVFDGDAVRRALGYNKLKSTLFQVSAEHGKFVFKGSGSGHGVGMCQWGARAQAKQGRSYRDILKFYFPEADLDSI